MHKLTFNLAMLALLIAVVASTLTIVQWRIVYNRIDSLERDQHQLTEITDRLTTQSISQSARQDRTDATVDKQGGKIDKMLGLVIQIEENTRRTPAQDSSKPRR